MTEWSFNRQVANAIVAGLLVSGTTLIWLVFFTPRAHRKDLSELPLALGLAVVVTCALFLFLFCWGAASALLARKSGWTEQRALRIAIVPAYLGLIATALGLGVLFYDLPLPRSLCTFGPVIFFFGRYAVGVCKKVYATIVESPDLVVAQAEQNAGAHP